LDVCCEYAALYLLPLLTPHVRKPHTGISRADSGSRRLALQIP
jgi:hypothetical protein